MAASVAEAELGTLFRNAQEAKVIRLVLEELGIHNHQIPYKLTTPQLLALLPTPSSNNIHAL
jgi:hypothetical protein